VPFAVSPTLHVASLSSQRIERLQIMLSECLVRASSAEEQEAESSRRAATALQLIASLEEEGQTRDSALAAEKRKVAALQKALVAAGIAVNLDGPEFQAEWHFISSPPPSTAAGPLPRLTDEDVLGSATSHLVLQRENLALRLELDEVRAPLRTNGRRTVDRDATRVTESPSSWSAAGMSTSNAVLVSPVFLSGIVEEIAALTQELSQARRIVEHCDPAVLVESQSRLREAQAIAEKARSVVAGEQHLREQHQLVLAKCESYRAELAELRHVKESSSASELHVQALHEQQLQVSQHLARELEETTKERNAAAADLEQLDRRTSMLQVEFDRMRLSEQHLQLLVEEERERAAAVKQAAAALVQEKEAFLTTKYQELESRYEGLLTVVKHNEMRAAESLDQRLADNDTALSALREALVASSAERDSLAVLYAQKRQENDVLQAMLSERDVHKAESNASLAETSRQLSKAVADLSSCRERIHQLERKLDQSRAASRAKCEGLSGTTSLLDALRASREACAAARQNVAVGRLGRTQSAAMDAGLPMASNEDQRTLRFQFGATHADDLAAIKEKENMLELSMEFPAQKKEPAFSSMPMSPPRMPRTPLMEKSTATDL
jgi:hypothetical protein